MVNHKYSTVNRNLGYELHLYRLKDYAKIGNAKWAEKMLHIGWRKLFVLGVSFNPQSLMICIKTILNFHLTGLQLNTIHGSISGIILILCWQVCNLPPWKLSAQYSIHIVYVRNRVAGLHLDLFLWAFDLTRWKYCAVAIALGFVTFCFISQIVREWTFKRILDLKFYLYNPAPSSGA